MKVAVYAIAKNEEIYAKRWAKSAEPADYRIVLDTGSRDKTVSILEQCGVTVKQESIEPWRFDTARNTALALVPHDVDVCVSLDLDEVLREGWREALEDSWTGATTLLRHPLYPAWNKAGTAPEQYFAYVGRAHARHAYEWRYAIHELLRPLGPHAETFTDGLVIDHIGLVERDKSFYKEMLERLVREEPTEPRYAFYFGVECYNRGDYQTAAGEFERYLALAEGPDGAERAFVRRILARAYKLLGRTPEAYMPLLYHATVDSPDERESWCELAQLCADIGNWPNCLSAAVNALRCTDQRKSFHIDLAVWEGLPERLLEQSAAQLGLPKEALDRLKAQIKA